MKKQGVISERSLLSQILLRTLLKGLGTKITCSNSNFEFPQERLQNIHGGYLMLKVEHYGGFLTSFQD